MPFQLHRLPSSSQARQVLSRRGRLPWLEHSTSPPPLAKPYSRFRVPFQSHFPRVLADAHPSPNQIHISSFSPRITIRMYEYLSICELGRMSVSSLLDCRLQGLRLCASHSPPCPGDRACCLYIVRLIGLLIDCFSGR